jgi:dTDP-4-amino-4,6-dideoxygalactose transaminase
MPERRRGVWRARRDSQTLVPLQRPTLPTLDQMRPYYEMSERARWFSNGGPCVSLLQDRIRAAVGAEPVVVANCTLGLIIAIRASVLARRTASRRFVVCPSYTFVATAASIVSAGFQPLFVDVDPVHWQPDPNAIDRALADHGSEIAAVLVTSTFGCPPALTVRNRWEVSCADHGVPLVVDSAAAFGATDEAGQMLGVQGDVEVFSFHATKPFAIGEGGAITTRDVDIASAAARMINFGFDAKRHLVSEGTNAKMSEIQAAAGLAAWDNLSDVLSARRIRARCIRDLLVGFGFSFQPLSNLATWQLVPTLAPSATERSVILERAARVGVEVRCYYDTPLHTAEPYRHHPMVGSLPVTTDLSQRTLSLPMANDLCADEILAIVQAVTGEPLDASVVGDVHALLEPGTRGAFSPNRANAFVSDKAST